MLLTLSEWVRPERIFELATICYVRRENDEATSALIAQRVAEYEEKYSARIIKIVPDEVKVVSSSELRESLKNGFDIGALPISVLEYIKEKGLYK
jgi:nicotinic acid mononucleotide adenylyltransferase